MYMYYNKLLIKHRLMEMVIAALEEAGLRRDVNVFVGGAPVSEDFADEIGADGYGDNAGQAVDIMKGMLN